MATSPNDLASSIVQIAGIGHVFHAPVDTKPMDLTRFNFGDASTYGSWTWMGDASADKLVEFKTDGGDVTFQRTWDRLNVSSTRKPKTITATINSVNVSGETFNLGFQGADVDPSTGAISVGTGAGASDHAILIVMEDGQKVAGLYLPNTSVSGDFPTLDLEKFTSIALDLAVVGSATQTTKNQGPLIWQWIPPVTRSGTAAAAVATSPAT